MTYGLSDFPCSGLLLECGALSRGALKCCAPPRSTCWLPRVSPCDPRELFGTGRTSLAWRALLNGVEFDRAPPLSRFIAFVGRSLRLPFRLDEVALAGRSERWPVSGRFPRSARAGTTSWPWKSPGLALAAMFGRP